METFEISVSNNLFEGVILVETKKDNNVLYCECYKSIFNIYGEFEYEDETCAEFIILRSNCNIDDNCEVKNTLEKYLNSEEFFTDCFKTKEIVDDSPKAQRERILKRYHETDFERMCVADALDELSSIAQDMADYIERYG